MAATREVPEAVTKVAAVRAVVGVRVLVATGTVEKVAASRVEAVLVVAAMAAGAGAAAEAEGQRRS